VAVAAAVAAAAGGKELDDMRFTFRFAASALTARLVALVAALGLFMAAASDAVAQQKAFASPEAAMNAFGSAIAMSDEDALKAVLGADFRTLIPPVGTEGRYRFLAAWAKSHGIKADGDARALVAVGNDGWTLPIPIVKTGEGWRFDTRAGADEMRIRRIGRNERAVMQVMLAIFDAQKDYARMDPNGDGVLEYASRLASSPGRRDGLYWPAQAGEPSSPLGPLVDAARAAGDVAREGYHGYRYRLLAGQGPSAPGGAYDYAVRGRKIGGFAAVAWPVRYGDTGVMTFMVSHDGVVHEQDLGPNTAARANAITRFDPGAGWRRAEP
jgi:hypothetical protein